MIDSFFVYLYNNNIELQENFIEFDISEEIKLMDLAGYPYEKQKIKK